MLDLNSEEIKAEGGAKKFDSTKIFGFEVVEDNEITKLAENVLISGFETGAAQSGSKFFDIKITDSKGNESNMREYEPDSTRDDYAKKCKSQQTRLKHILTKYVPEGTVLPAVATFPELWAAVQALLTAHQCNTKPMRLKLVYNNKGFLAVPPYVPFLEPMSIPAGDGKLNLNPQFDQLIRPQADSPAKVVAVGTASDEDLPF